MANKKYKLTDGNYWATDGVYDFDQTKTQREINGELSDAVSDLNGAITPHAISNVDLNTITTQGLYVCNGGITNSPNNIGYGYLTVFEDSPACKQEFTYYTSMRKYYRIKFNGVWTAWSEIVLADSAQLTGTPTAPTANSGTNTTQIATTAFVQSAITPQQAQITGNIETSTTASKTYYVGEYLVLNGVLYKVINGITSGATIIPGTNVEVKTVTDELTLDNAIPITDLLIQKIGNIRIMRFNGVAITNNEGLIGTLSADIPRFMMRAVVAVLSPLYFGWVNLNTDGTIVAQYAATYGGSLTPVPQGKYVYGEVIYTV